jgi:methionine synthase II (cobalamin-independent)
MKLSKDRILTTHVGSLPRSEKFLNLSSQRRMEKI